MEKDLVKITCYGSEKVMERQQAIEFYLECMEMSEGSERNRYENIYFGLLDGKKVVSDEDYY